MAVRFQTISDDQFNYEEDFVVKESKTMNLIIGIFFLAFSIAAISINWFGWLLAFPSAAYIINGFRNIVVMRVNKNGFYYGGELITNWDNFMDVEFIDPVPLPTVTTTGTSDRFYLMLRYYKEGADGYFGREIPLTDTQDKSEEEIIAAIKFYYKNHTKVSA